MENVTNIFSNWKAAKDGTWFTTRSPYPEVPCHISPVPLKTVSSYSSYLSLRASVSEVKEYLEQQVLILKYNNPEHKAWMIKAAITSRIVYWKCNNILRKDDYYLGEMLQLILNDCFADGNSTPTMKYDETKYWYSDEISKLSGGDKTKAKQVARYAVVSEGDRDDMRESSLEYRRENYDVLPTVKVLSHKSRYSRNTVIKLGEGLYIPQVDNIKQRVQKVREFYPELKQKEVAEELVVSLITVKRYWRSK